MSDWRNAGLDDRRTAMLRYVDKLTRTPHEVTKPDIDDLRSAGFTDRDILDICTVASYYAYANRLTSGLGVPLESWLNWSNED